jgi:PadR family transcriptional regulator, regulatory protein PadR
MKGNLFRGSLSTVIIHLLAEQGEMYGYQISKLAKERSDEKISITEGALYPILHKLEAENIISSETRFVDNRYRKYYKITEEGQIHQQSLIAEMMDYLKTMELILSPSTIQKTT